MLLVFGLSNAILAFILPVGLYQLPEVNDDGTNSIAHRIFTTTCRKV